MGVDYSSWDHFRDLSVKSHNAYKSAMAAKHYEAALRDAHFYIETAMKAVIRKQKVAVIKTHDLRELANIKVNGREFLSRKLNESPAVRKSFSIIYSSWRSEDKYRVLNVTQDDVASITLHCGKVHQWLMKQLFE